ncbi:MAG: helix-turn-helix domain-containing protein [Mycobacterium sp.]|nr:helix-turn-helix domain-containing protein [Mycobacterium sp.]
MSESVKREYRSDLRAAQAQETRRRIVAAAAELFVSQGYGGTSVDAIAAAAGVSRKTVFTAVGGKAELLALALDWAVAGDDAPVAVAERPEVVALLRLDDPGALLDGWARVLAGIDARVGDLFTALEVAASIDETARSLFERMQGQRRDGAQAVVDAVAELGGLGDGMTRSQLVDLAWLLTEPMLYTRLVGTRGWSGKRFERWLADTLRQQLLRPSPPNSDSR